MCRLLDASAFPVAEGLAACDPLAATVADKKAIVEAFTANGIPFIDTGVGLSKDPNGINGQLRITTSTPDRNDHITNDGLISYFAGDDAEYDTNLQVDELNALTANYAIIRYKKLLGFYADVEDERHTVYVVDSGDLHHRYGTSETADPVDSWDVVQTDGEKDAV